MRFRETHGWAVFVATAPLAVSVSIPQRVRRGH